MQVTSTAGPDLIFSTVPSPTPTQEPDPEPPVEPTSKPELPVESPIVEPTPEPKPEPVPITNFWRIRLHHTIESKNSAVLWTLLDSNGDAAGSGQGSPISSNFRKDGKRALDYVVEMNVRDETNEVSEILYPML